MHRRDRSFGCLLLAACLGWLAAAAPLHAFTLVEEGVGRAVIVTADRPAEMARYAAAELVSHIEKASGVRLDVVTESEASEVTGPRPHRVYVGVTRAMREAGLPYQALADDAFLLKVVGTDLFVTGPADGHQPMSEEPDSKSGTLYGVYELLEEAVGVRWLWPGELGTFVPRRTTIRVDPKLDRQVAPAYAFRQFNSTAVLWSSLRYDRDNGSRFYGKLSFTEEGLTNYSRDLHLYKRRHRLGDTAPKPYVTHMFTGWWAKFGEKHPEWFRMDENGRRGPRDNPNAFQLRQVGMCFTNPGLQKHLLDAWGGKPVLSLGDVDTRTFCQCPNCLALEGPQLEAPPSFASTLYRPWVTDRYVRIWQHFRERAVERNPDVLVTSYLYWNYLPAPSEPVDLSVGYYGEFVPWGQDTIAYWPLSAEANQWLREQWLGWQKTGIRLAYRPNYFHGGYVMPHLSTRQVGEFLQFATEHGMEGFRQDSLYGHWATKGPMLYLHMRLAVDPTLDIDAILEEYYEAFGPAAAAVRAYFDDWEDYSAKRPGNALFNPVMVHLAYPADVFGPAEKQLAKALALAEADAEPEYAERVRFLQLGLEHARLSRDLFSHLSAGRLPTESPQRLAAARRALEDLRSFRLAHEEKYIADYRHASWQEMRFIKLDEFFVVDLEAAPQAAAADTLIPMTDWTFRKDPEDRGVKEKWFAAAGTSQAEGWHPITVPSFWADTQVGDYQGYGWYRFRFRIPQMWRNEAMHLFFEAVDEQAWIYLNGEPVGEHTTTSENARIGQLWNRPFSLTLSPSQLKANEENELVIRVHNAVANGGIWGNVRLFGADDLN